MPAQKLLPACGFCNSTDGSCVTARSGSYAKPKITSTCPICPANFSLARAKPSAAQPATNLPMACPTCSASVWSYALLEHVRHFHPTIDISDPPAILVDLLDIPTAEMLAVLKKEVLRVKAAARRA